MRARNIVAAALVATCVAVGFAAPAGAASVYWGANIGSHLTGATAPYDMSAADKFEGLAGKRMSLMEYSLPWAHCDTTPCTFTPFPSTQMEAIRQRGSIPVFGWASYSQPLDQTQPDFKLSKITGGAYDDYIREWAIAARDWGHPFFLTFDWEMNINGLWPYSEAVNGNAKGDFVKMWRHVHDIFRDEGATNATWVWCVNGEYEGSLPLKGLYPGDGYVDWTCADVYNWNYVWRPFTEVLGPTYDTIQAVAPTKPVMIGETASSEKGGSKAAWITDMLSVQLPRNFQNVKAMVWFEKYDQDWPIETSEASRAAFAAGIGSSYYADASFGDISGPIQPLSPIVTKSSGDDPSVADPSKPGAAGGNGSGTSGGSSKRCVARRSKTTGKRVLVCRKASVITGLAVSPHVRSGFSLPSEVAAANATFRITVNRNTTVTLRFARRSGKSYRTVPGSVRVRLKKGARGIVFAGRFSGDRKLTPGRYRVSATATAAAGKSSQPVRTTFTLLK